MQKLYRLLSDLGSILVNREIVGKNYKADCDFLAEGIKATGGMSEPSGVFCLVPSRYKTYRGIFVTWYFSPDKERFSTLSEKEVPEDVVKEGIVYLSKLRDFFEQRVKEEQGKRRIPKDERLKSAQDLLKKFEEMGGDGRTRAYYLGEKIRQYERNPSGKNLNELQKEMEMLDRLPVDDEEEEEESEIEEAEMQGQLTPDVAPIKVEEKVVPTPPIEYKPEIIESAPEPTDREGQLRKIMREIASTSLRSEVDGMAYSLLHEGIKINVSDRSDEAVYKRTLLGQLWDLRQMERLERIARKGKEPYDLYKAKFTLDEEKS